MHTLRVLGGFALSDPTDPQGLRLSQRRAEAMLAVLAVAGELGATRDRLLSVFWPERSEGQARHALRDELYVVRQALGADVILGDGDDLRLNPARITSDVQRFSEAIATGEWSSAVAVYRGHLLAGFHVRGASEFEHWLDAERARLFRECKSAIEALASDAERAVAWREAAEWWGRAVELDPYDTRVVVRRVVALARSGDRANALREGEEHRRRLETEMELEPDPAFLEELAKVQRGDFMATWFTTPEDRKALPAVQPQRAGKGGRGRRNRPPAS